MVTAQDFCKYYPSTIDLDHDRRNNFEHAEQTAQNSPFKRPSESETRVFGTNCRVK